MVLIQLILTLFTQVEWMPWAQLILDFVAQVAWPVVVLALGLKFRKPIIAILKRSLQDGTMTRFRVGANGVDVEWAVREGVARAKEALDESKEIPDESENKTCADPELPSAKETTPSPEPKAVATSLSKIAERYARLNLKFREARPVSDIDPKRVVNIGGEYLRAGLDHALESVPEARAEYGDRLGNMALIQSALAAEKYDLLTGEELMAVRELIQVHNEVMMSQRPFAISTETVDEYAESVRRLVKRARTRAITRTGSRRGRTPER